VISAVYLRTPARSVLLACGTAFAAAVVWPSVTTGVLAAAALLAGSAVLFALDAASRRGRSAARRWQR